MIFNWFLLFYVLIIPLNFFASNELSDEKKWLALDMVCKNINHGGCDWVLPLSETNKALRYSIADACGYELTKRAIVKNGVDVVKDEIDKTQSVNLIDFKVSMKKTFFNCFVDTFFFNVGSTDEILSKIKAYCRLGYSEEEGNFLSCIYDVVNNEKIDQLKKKRRTIVENSLLNVLEKKERKYITSFSGRYFIDLTRFFKNASSHSDFDTAPAGVIYYDNGVLFNTNNIRPLFKKNLNSQYYFTAKNDALFTTNFHDMLFLQDDFLCSTIVINGTGQTTVPEEIIFPENRILQEFSIFSLDRVKKLDLSLAKNLKKLKIASATALEQLILPGPLTSLEITSCENLSIIDLSQSVKLEELVLYQTKNLENFIVSDLYPALKKLKIGSFLGKGYREKVDSTLIIMNALENKLPNLKELIVDDFGNRGSLSKRANYPNKAIDVKNMKHLESIDITRTKRDLRVYNCESLKKIKIAFGQSSYGDTSECLIENSGNTNLIIDSFRIERGKLRVKNCPNIKALVLKVGPHKGYFDDFIKKTTIINCPNLKIIPYSECDNGNNSVKLNSLHNSNNIHVYPKPITITNKSDRSVGRTVDSKNSSNRLSKTVEMEGDPLEGESNSMSNLSSIAIETNNDEHLSNDQNTSQALTDDQSDSQQDVAKWYRFNKKYVTKYVLPCIGLAAMPLGIFLFIKYFRAPNVKSPVL